MTVVAVGPAQQSRRALIAARLIFFGTALGVECWTLLGGWRADGLSVFLPLFGGMLALVVGTFADLDRPGRTLTCSNGSFVAGPNYLALAGYASNSICWFAYSVPIAIAGEATAGPDPSPVWIGLGVTALVLLIVVQTSPVLTHGRYGVELRPDEIWIRHLHGEYHIPWAAVSPLAPRLFTMRIQIDRPDLVVSAGQVKRRPRRIWLPQWINVNRDWTAAIIRWYALQPEHRAAIGTPQEYELLHGRPGTASMP